MAGGRAGDPSSHLGGHGVFGQAGAFTYRTYVVAGLDATGFAADSLGEGRQESRTEISKNLVWFGASTPPPCPLMVGGSVCTGGSAKGLRSPEGSILSVPTRLYEGHREWKHRGLKFRAPGAVATLGDVAALNETLGLSGNQSLGEGMSGYYMSSAMTCWRAQRPAVAHPYVRYEDYSASWKVKALAEEEAPSARALHAATLLVGGSGLVGAASGGCPPGQLGLMNRRLRGAR